MKEKNLRAGFIIHGIIPLCVEQTLEMQPNKRIEREQSELFLAVNDTYVELLENIRLVHTKISERRGY